MHFPIQVEGLYHWWSIDGGIKHADPPKSWTGSHATSAYPPKPDGFYTQAEVDEWETVQAMLVYIQQLEGSIRLKSCSASLGCPQPAQTGGYDWAKLERELPLSTIMSTLKDAWEWLGYVDQGLMLVFVPLLIVLLVKVRHLENASTSQQGAVNVAVSAPAVLPLQPANISARRPTERHDPYDQYRLAYN